MAPKSCTFYQLQHCLEGGGGGGNKFLRFFLGPETIGSGVISQQDLPKNAKCPETNWPGL